MNTDFLPKTPIESDPPKAPLRGSLILTGEQEKSLTRHFLERMRSALSSYSAGGWLERRNRAMAHYNNDVSDRKIPGTVFALSNMTLNLPKRYVRITASRVYDEILTATPLISVTVEGKEDDWEDARVIERYCSHKIEEAKLRSTLREAEMLAALRGETVVKTTWKTTSTRAFREARVLMAGDGSIMTAGDGNPIMDTDAFETGEDGHKFLLRDPRVKLPEKPVWEMKRVAVVRKLYDGLESACIDHRDFLCNTTETCVHKADFVGIKVGIPADEVFGMLAPLGKEKPEVMAFLQKIQNTTQPRDATESGQPDAHRGEDRRPEDAIPIIPFLEVYARVVVSEDGQSDEIAALLDVENEQLLTYDYLANISPTGRRPFRVVRMEPVPHRWFGTGFYELFSDRHNFCDLFLNRVNLGASLSGNIKIENPMATEEGLAGEPIEFGTNKTYRLREGYTVDDVFKVIPIPNDTGPSNSLLNMLLQITQLEAGVVSAGDHGMAALPAASLATGIKSLDRVANVLLKNILFDFINGFEDILHDAVALILTYHSTEDATRLMGAESAALLAKYRDISLLPYRTKLQLSASKDADVIENHTRAMELLMQWAALDPETRERLRPLLIKILTVMGIEDVDKALAEAAAPLPPPPGTPEGAAPDGAAQDAMRALAQAAQPQPESKDPVGTNETPRSDALIV